MNNIDTAREAYGAFGSGDMPSLQSKFSDDAVWVVSDEVPNGGEIRGAANIIASFESLFDTWSTVEVRPEEFIDGGDWVTVRGTERFANANGSVTAPYAHLIKFDHGKIVRGEFFQDTAKITALL